MTEKRSERRQAKPDTGDLSSIEAIMTHGEMTPPEKLNLLTEWDVRQGLVSRTGWGRVAGAADLGFPDPAPYSESVQRAIVELYRKHRDALPDPATWRWRKAEEGGGGK